MKATAAAVHADATRRGKKPFLLFCLGEGGGGGGNRRAPEPLAKEPLVALVDLRGLGVGPQKRESLLTTVVSGGSSTRLGGIQKRTVSCEVSYDTLSV